MNLTHKESDLVFAIMKDLSGEFSHEEIRGRVGRWLLELLNADYFASYAWDEAVGAFVSGVQINMSPDNLARYEAYYQFNDPITPILQRRRSATPVSRIMRHDRLTRTEFYNDFLRRDGLCYGLNFFAYDRGHNIGDVRIWRAAQKADFTERDASIVDAIGPSLVNALVRANRMNAMPIRRFAQIGPDHAMTKRECEIADMLAAGLTDEDICASLCVSKPTLRTHIGAIFRKTGVKRRSQLALLLSG